MESDLSEQFRLTLKFRRLLFLKTGLISKDETEKGNKSKRKEIYARVAVLLLWCYTFECLNLKFRFAKWLSHLVGTETTFTTFSEGKPNFDEMYRTCASVYFGMTATIVTYNYLQGTSGVFQNIWDQFHWSPSSVLRERMVLAHRFCKWFNIYCLLTTNLISTIVLLVLIQSAKSIVDQIGYIRAAYAMTCLSFGIIYCNTLYWTSAHYFLVVTLWMIQLFDDICDQICYILVGKVPVKMLEQAQLRHNGVSDMLKYADQHYKCYLSVIYISFIPIICLVLHHMIFIVENFLIVLMMSTFMMLIMVVFLATTFSAAVLHHSASRPYHYVYGVMVLANPSPEQFDNAMVFLEKLDKKNIGYTCLNFFIFTKKTILNVFSAFITYFLLYIQINSSARKA